MTLAKTELGGFVCARRVHHLSLLALLGSAGWACTDDPGQGAAPAAGRSAGTPDPERLASPLLLDPTQEGVEGLVDDHLPSRPQLGEKKAIMVHDSRRGSMLLYGAGPANDETWEYNAGPARWTRRTPASGPGSRWNHSLAYDVARGKVLLFGGRGGHLCDDTWEWDGAAGTWTRRLPVGSPSARDRHVTVYDPIRRKVVLFGGIDGTSSPCDDTWEWDGAAGTWTQRNLVVRPPASHSGGLVWDGSRQKALLFGGWSRLWLNDTWEWDGATWTQRHPTITPEAISHFGLAYHAGRRTVLLFGGSGASLWQNGTWEWDGAAGTWTLLHTPDNLEARREAALVYDPVRSKMVLFGGRDTELFHDTWEWDGLRGWTQRSTDRPPGREDHAMAYDARRHTVVLFGGMASPLANDTWEWDCSSSRWTQRDPPSSPEERSKTAMAYDASRGKVLLFGGWGRGRLADTWEWDGAAGTWEQRVPVVSPPARSWHALAYDASRQRIVLFGGEGHSVTDIKDDTWEWDGHEGTWNRREPAVHPPGRAGHALAYDASRQRVLLFAGRDQQDTWEWDGAAGNWIERHPASAPGHRQGHALVHDEARRTVLLFGGTSIDDRVNTWEWDGAVGNWNPRHQVRAPFPRTGLAMVYDSLRRKALLFGGTSYSRDTAETWEWDGEEGAWTEQNPETTPHSEPTEPSYLLYHDEQRQKLVLFNGGVYTCALYTWEMDSRTLVWTPPRVPHEHPTCDSGNPSRLVYDAGRGRAVLYEVIDSGVPSGNTWEYDGESGTWTGHEPQIFPGRYAAVALVYDRARRKVLLFGEVSDRSRTWEWDGAARRWTDRTPAVSPPVRERHSLAYDASRSKVLLHGGWSHGEPLGDTWEWDGAAGSWTQLEPIGRPPAAGTGQLVYDAARQRVLLLDSANTMWEWDAAATSWVQRTPVLLTLPPGRLVYDSTRERVLLVGGNENDTLLNLDQLWEWDGEAGTWTRRVVAPRVTRAAGPAAWFSGRDAAHRLADTTFVFRGGAGWQPYGATGSALQPPARTDAAAAFDPERRVQLVVGGRDAQGELLGDLWRLEGRAWTRLELPQAFGARAGVIAAFDSRAGTALFFGGTDGQQLLGDTWRVGQVVEQLAPARTPSARADGAAVFSPALGQVVLFGGRAGGGALNDTWVWDGAEWTSLQPGVRPAARYGHRMVYSDYLGKVLLIGGTDGGTDFGDVWGFDGETWTQLETGGPALTPRAFAVVELNDWQLDVLGGETADGRVVSEPWSGVLLTGGLRCPDQCVDPERPCLLGTCHQDGSCSYVPKRAGTVCRPAAGPCDEDDDVCTGDSPECPESYVPAGRVCRPADGPCDEEDVCTGEAPNCPARFKAPGEPCGVGPCSEDSSCTGDSAICPAAFKIAGTVCLPAAGPCDVDDLCSGDSAACPATYRAAGTVCSRADGLCDADDLCSGAAAECPARIRAAGEVCRIAEDPCDEDDLCNGVSTDCPPRRKDPGAVCRPAERPCEEDARCSDDSLVCVESFVPVGTLCREANGACDVADFCTGDSGECPDGYRGAGTLCREADCRDGLTVGQSFCSGVAGDCPRGEVSRCAPYLCAGSVCAVTCQVGAECVEGSWCNEQGECVDLREDGRECEEAGRCTSGNCVDGRCCDSRCTGPCEACDVEGQEGRCMPVTGPPHGTRAACTSDGSACGGACNGRERNACTYPGARTRCAASSCEEGGARADAFCSGEGICRQPPLQDCSPYRCWEGICVGECHSDPDCDGEHYCSAGICVERLDLGGPCLRPEQCRSGFCVDGRCCEEGCSAQCAACDVAGSEGFCTPVQGDPRFGRPGCPGLGPCRGTCNGRDMECTLPGEEVECSPASCQYGSQVDPSVCDEAGSCTSPESRPCGAYTCDLEGYCRTACVADEHCNLGNRCLHGACVAAGSKNDAAAAGESGCNVLAGGDTSASGSSWLLSGLLLLAIQLAARRRSR